VRAVELRLDIKPIPGSDFTLDADLVLLFPDGQFRPSRAFAVIENLISSQ
jgi:hypothetical protein